MFTASNCKSLCACLCCVNSRLKTKNMKNENHSKKPRIQSVSFWVGRGFLQRFIKLFALIVAAWEITNLNRHICFSNLTIRNSS